MVLSFVLSAAILKDADFSEVDRAECQFATTATVLDNGSQVRSLCSVRIMVNPIHPSSIFEFGNFVSDYPFSIPQDQEKWVRGFDEARVEEVMGKCG